MPHERFRRKFVLIGHCFKLPVARTLKSVDSPKTDLPRSSRYGMRRWTCAAGTSSNCVGASATNCLNLGAICNVLRRRAICVPHMERVVRAARYRRPMRSLAQAVPSQADNGASRSSACRCLAALPSQRHRGPAASKAHQIARYRWANSGVSN